MTDRGRVIEFCSLCPVIPVLEVANIEDAEPLAHALLGGGLRVLEVTLRTDSALDVISNMSKVEGVIVGAGTLRTPNHILAAREAGASFGVSPGATDGMLSACQDEDFPILPGAASASEVMVLLEKGYTALKFFPAEAAGGRALLKSLAGPFPDALFCPTGGITRQSASQYLELPNVMCVGGSWLAPIDLINAKNWQEIEIRARLANELGAR